MRFPRRALAILAACALPPLAGPPARATDYYVSPGGSDANPGDGPARPFRTLARAAGVLRPGDTCWLRGGVYREGVVLARSGGDGRPITFAAFPGETPVVDGSDLVAGPWTRVRGRVWSAPVAGPVEAVFCDGKMMVEARWPDCTWDENWEPGRKWALTGPGSGLGRIESAEIARSGEDFSGGLVYIKLSKGNGCYTRRILSHRAGSPTVLWDASGLPSGPPERLWKEDALPARIRKFGFAGNRFFVVAAGALDAPQEWWYDPASRELEFIAPDGSDPAGHAVSVKRRVSGFSGSGLSDLVFRGLEFRACNLRFAGCRRVRVEGCRFLYPATLREFPDEPSFAARYRPLWLQGTDNVVERCEIAWALDAGLVVEGSGNRVEDCVVHDVNLDGRHPGPGISVRGVPPPSGPMEPNVVRRCTVYDVGGVGIYALGSGPAIIDRNHLFDGGLYCVDVSALYIPTGDRMAGTVVAYNWFHDQRGLGFRVDQDGRGILFHHNLAWNCAAGCKLEGFAMSAYDNTVLVDNPKAPFMVVFDRGASPAAWRIRDNAAFGFIDRRSLRESVDPGRIRPLARRPGAIDHDVAIPAGRAADYFVDPAAFDFRPKPGGPLDGAGVPVAGITPPSAGAPSVGALEAGAAPWIAGADWLDGGLPVPRSALAATGLARSLRPAGLPVGEPATWGAGQ